jgi:hypothetical protein
VSGPHIPSHQTEILQASGFVLDGPQPLITWTPPQLAQHRLGLQPQPQPQHHQHQQQQQHHHQYEQQQQQQQQQQQSPHQQGQVNGGWLAENSPQPSQQLFWTILFNHQDLTATQCYVTLINAFFVHLDPGRTGYLSPESYAKFQEAQGHAPEHNICKYKNAIEPTANLIAVGTRQYRQSFANTDVERRLQADAALKKSFDAFSIQHGITQRLNAPPGQMPVLTPKGLKDITAIDVLTNPNQAWNDLNRALRVFQLPLWQQHGDIPRQAFPAVPEQRVLNYVQQISQQQTAMAIQSAQITFQANQAATMALPDAGWRWEWH